MIWPEMQDKPAIVVKSESIGCSKEVKAVPPTVGMLVDSRSVVQILVKRVPVTPKVLDQVGAVAPELTIKT